MPRRLPPLQTQIIKEGYKSPTLPASITRDEVLNMIKTHRSKATKLGEAEQWFDEGGYDTELVSRLSGIYVVSGELKVTVQSENDDGTRRIYVKPASSFVAVFSAEKVEIPGCAKEFKEVYFWDNGSWYFIKLDN